MQSLGIQNLPLPEVADFWARHDRVVGKARTNLELMVDSESKYRLFAYYSALNRWLPFLKCIYRMLSALWAVERYYGGRKRGDEQASKVYFEEIQQQDRQARMSSLWLVPSTSA